MTCVVGRFSITLVNIISIIGQSTPVQPVHEVWVVSDDFYSILQPIDYPEYNAALSNHTVPFPIIILC